MYYGKNKEEIPDYTIFIFCRGNTYMFVFIFSKKNNVKMIIKKEFQVTRL